MTISYAYIDSYFIIYDSFMHNYINFLLCNKNSIIGPKINKLPMKVYWSNTLLLFQLYHIFSRTRQHTNVKEEISFLF